MFEIDISLSKQQLDVYRDAELVGSYSISSGVAGVGCEKGSGKTPIGKHIIRAKIGYDQPVNSVFIGRRPTGEIYSSELAKDQPNRDWILSRILWLSGTELRKNRLGNVDTMQRYIYIHGTPDSEPMGVAASHGCIRMRNKDLVELYEMIPVYTPVEIKA